jgi:hypothetical protein
VIRVAMRDDVGVVAGLLSDFRDHEGRHWPPHHLMLRGVERLIGRDDGEFLLGGDPPAGIVQLRSLGFRSGGDEPGRLAVFLRRRVDENVPPGWG